MISEDRFFKTVVQLYKDEEYPAVEYMVKYYAMKNGDAYDRVYSMVKSKAEKCTSNS